MTSAKRNVQFQKIDGICIRLSTAPAAVRGLTILDALPYDRERTSMKEFPMCRIVRRNMMIEDKALRCAAGVLQCVRTGGVSDWKSRTGQRCNHVYKEGDQ